MTFTEKILKMAMKNNGIITTAQITQAGINRQHLKLLLEKGKLERSDIGVYILPDYIDDEMFNLQNRYKKGIFSHITALYLLNLTDKTPEKFCMTFPLNYNTSKINKRNLNIYRVKNEYHEIGIIKIKSPNGNIIKSYNAERTLCDILKTRAQMDIQIITQAYQKYFQESKRNINLLSEYSKIFKLEKKVRNYLEVLI